MVAELELERHRHEDTSRALAKAHESRAHAEAEAARLSRRLEEERGGAGGARAALAAERQAAHLAREEAEDARTAVAELDAAVAELGAQKRVLVAGLRARERALGDRCAVAEARAEEAGMMRRAAETRVRELEEDAERREAAQADGEIRMQRLRAEKKVLLAEIRRGVTAGVGGVAGIDMASAGVAPGRVGEGGGDVENTSELDRMSEVEGGDGGDGVDSGGGGVRGGSSSPRASEESAQDRKVRACVKGHPDVSEYAWNAGNCLSSVTMVRFVTRYRTTRASCDCRARALPVLHAAIFERRRVLSGCHKSTRTAAFSYFSRPEYPGSGFQLSVSVVVCDGHSR